MKRLPDLLRENEEWLMERILQYAKRYGYTKYTSTLLAPWRMSISGLTSSLCQAIESHTEYHLEVDAIIASPLTAFGVMEAHTHRDRGISLDMFMSLMKYYRDSYLDLVEAFIEELPTDENAKYFILHAFDVMEVAFIEEWGMLSSDDIFRGMQQKTRTLTNDKNFYVTVFESIPVPLIILSDSLGLINMNFQAVQLFTDMILRDAEIKDSTTSFVRDNDNMSRMKQVNFSKLFQYDFQAFIDNRTSYQENVVATIETDNDLTRFSLDLMKILDVSGKFNGIIVTITVLSDMVK